MGVVFIVLLEGRRKQTKLANTPHLYSTYQTNSTATNAVITIKDGYISLLNRLQLLGIEFIVYSNCLVVPRNGYL